MKRSQVSSSTSRKNKAKQAHPDISDFTDIKWGVSEGVFEGKPAVAKKNVSDEYLSLYNLWKSTKALPEVYEAWRDEETKANVVVMEKMVPFVYQKELEQAYYAAIEEVYRLSKFKNLDISPANTMMRAGGQIVFVDLWTNGVTSVYFVPRSNEDPLPGIKKSLGRVLFDYKHKEAIIRKRKEEVEELKSIIPDKKRLGLFTYSDSRVYEISNEVDPDLYTLIHVGTALKRAKMAKKFIEERGKTMQDYVMKNITESTIPEFDRHAEAFIYNTWKKLEDIAKELGANEEEINIFKEI